MYDAPYEKTEKKWLLDELIRHHCDVEDVKISQNLFSVKQQRFGIAKLIHIVFRQSRKAIASSDSNDVIICWGDFQGLILNAACLLLHKKRNLVLLHWLTPQGSFLSRFVRKPAVMNSNVKIVVNDPHSAEKWCQYLKADFNRYKGKFYYLPDAYSTDETFVKPKIHLKRYCFVGGYNNRDWKKVLAIANELDAIDFLCIADRMDFQEKTKGLVIPSNVQVKLNVKAAEYYQDMKQAYIVLLPLIDDSAAGLINICYSAVFGIPCLAEDTASLKYYYDTSTQRLLVHHSQWCDAIRELYALDNESYLILAANFQDYVKQVASPEQYVLSLLKIIDNKNGTEFK